jgi:hypothetical protein
MQISRQEEQSPGDGMSAVALSIGQITACAQPDGDDDGQDDRYHFRPLPSDEGDWIGLVPDAPSSDDGTPILPGQTLRYFG